ncbi:MAG: anti-sigma factor [Xanthobacteraceae bacterium]|nr:anti-sigma factor [Xanthobacteraceae bacterium]
MRCDHARERIGALIDGELPVRQHRGVADHADTCPACARYRDELRNLSARLPAARMRAPQGLAQRIQARLAVEPSQPEELATPRPASWLPAAKIAAAFAAMTGGRVPALRQVAVLLMACVVSALATWWTMQAAGVRQDITRDVLAAHVRSLLQDKTVQVASNDTHNVKPWFAGRLEFTPVVKDLSAEGYQLVGGRLDYVGGRRVAALVYKKRLHQISVFIWPSGNEAALKLDTAEGYNVASWSRGGMAFWAISDLNAGELRDLPSLL